MPNVFKNENDFMQYSHRINLNSFYFDHYYVNSQLENEHACR